jgi:hemolysin III
MPATEATAFVFRNPVSAGTHLLWCAFSFFATAMLWRLAHGDRRRQFYAGCFGLSMVLLYGASGTYHALCIEESALKYFRLLDHSAIYVLIAGTYTPICALVMDRPWRTVVLALQWTLALIGISCKWLLPAPPYGVTVGLYVAMGWVGLVPLPLLLRALGWRGMSWVFAGGLLYTLGGICDAFNWPTLLPGIITPHEVLHVCDMAATTMHVYFVARFVIPYRPVLVPSVDSSQFSVVSCQ